MQGGGGARPGFMQRLPPSMGQIETMAKDMSLNLMKNSLVWAHIMVLAALDNAASPEKRAVKLLAKDAAWAGFPVRFAEGCHR